MQELEKLKKLVLEGGFDEESKREVEELEKQFRQEVIKQQLSEHPTVKPYIDYLKSDIERANKVLSEEESLEDKDRLKLLYRKKECQRFLDIFISNKEQVEQAIKQKLDVAEAQ